MKIPIIGDTHLGARGSNPHIRNFISEYMEYLFKDMHDRGCSLYIQVGDAFDSRTSLNALDYKFVSEKFIPLHHKYEISGIYLDGNHDLAYKESSSVSWVQMLSDLSKGYIERIANAQDFDLGDCTIAMLPWINQENLEESMKFLESSKSKVLCGHLELGGFKMYNSSVCDESRFNLGVANFKNFDLVASGHFHTKSEDGIIQYVGTPYPLTWQDYLDAEEGKRGYHILDTDTNTLEFIPNPKEVNTFFKVFVYDWKQLNIDNEKQLQYKSVEELSTTYGLEGKVVKIMVADRGNQKHYEDFMSAVRQCKTIDVTVIDNTENSMGGVLGDGESISTASQEELSVQTDVISVLKQRVDKGTLEEGLRQSAKDMIDEVHSVASTKVNI